MVASNGFSSQKLITKSRSQCNLIVLFLVLTVTVNLSTVNFLREYENLQDCQHGSSNHNHQHDTEILAEILSPVSSKTAVSVDAAPVVRHNSPSSVATVPFNNALATDGGFCTASDCKIGSTVIREAFQQAPEAVAALRSNPFKKITVADDISFDMFLRDPRTDTFISGVIASGRIHDPLVLKLVEKYVHQKQNAVFIDIGANIGYFTANALALGARTISFEPFYENAGALMNTIERNGWKERSTLYMNALGYESNRVTMKSTNERINLSNMHVTGSECATAAGNGSAASVENKRYGVDYMDGVSLDQVMLTKHRDIQRVHLMKIDVETYEIHVLNGAMHTLCNVVVERIVVEIEYLKPQHKLVKDCDFARLHETLDKMGYTIMDNAEKQTYPTNVPLANMPGEVVLVLKNTTQSPAERLRGSADNVCQPFDLGSSK